MKHPIRQLVLCSLVVWMALAPGALLAQNPDLVAAARKFMDTMGDGKGTEIQKAVQLFREAGLSYQANLVVPRYGIIDCKDRKDQLQVLAGMYWTDVVYAYVFGKRDVAATTHELLQQQVMGRLAVRAKIHVSPVSPDAEKMLFDSGPESQAKFDAFIRDTQANFKRMVKEAENDPEVLDFLMDRFFGKLVELLHLGCRLGLGAPGGEKLVPLFNMISAHIDVLVPVLDSLKDKKLDPLFYRSERTLFLNGIKNIIQKKGGKMEAADLRSILLLVAPVRNSYIAKCE